MKFIICSMIFIICVGCGGQPDPFEVAESTQNCLGPFVSDDGTPINGQAVRSNERLLKRLFENPWNYVYGQHLEYSGTHQALLHNDKEFCEAFGGIRIIVKNTFVFPCSTGECFGLDTNKGIYLQRDGQALLHELLHVYELEHWVFNTAEHPHWAEKGYYYLGENIYPENYSPALLK